MQVDEFLASIAVHSAGCRIGLDHQTGFDIVEDQPVASSFEDLSIWLFFVFTLQVEFLAGKRCY